MAAFIPTDLRIYRFHPEGLDPIAVYVEQYGPRSSRITVQCFSRAWTAYWALTAMMGLRLLSSNATRIMSLTPWPALACTIG